MIFPLEETITREERTTAMHQQPALVWLTGLSGSGKTTIAVALERRLLEKGFKAYLLDGDTVRAGLNKDLGFADADRQENIRRIGEVCRLLCDAGLIVITAFISPFSADRNFVRSLFPASDFSEVYVNAPLDTCETRDVKGLYEKARKGIITDFTGIDSPYEIPTRPELTLHTDRESEDESVNKVIEYLLPRISLAL
jgi:adenylyl-sulfate kinase